MFNKTPRKSMVSFNSPPVGKVAGKAVSRGSYKTLVAERKLMMGEPQKKVAFGSAIKSLPLMMVKMVRLSLMALAGFVVLLIVSVMLVGGYLYLSKSDYFAVSQVNIHGISKLSREDILLATGLNQPTNNLTFDTLVAEKSLVSLPWVDSARIIRKLPDILDIEVVEYRPRALVSLDQLHYIDDQGRPFKKLEPGENPDLPILSGFSVDDLVSRGPMTREALREVFNLINILKTRTDEFKIDSISEINYDPDRGMTIFTRHTGIQLKVGFGAFEEKLRRLGRVVAHLKLEGKLSGLEYMNLESPPRVTVRFSGEEIHDT